MLLLQCLLFGVCRLQKMYDIDQASGDCTETSPLQLQPVSLLLPEINIGSLKPVVQLKRLDVQRSLLN